MGERAVGTVRLTSGMTAACLCCTGCRLSCSIRQLCPNVLLRLGLGAAAQQLRCRARRSEQTPPASTPTPYTSLHRPTHSCQHLSLRGNNSDTFALIVGTVSQLSLLQPSHTARSIPLRADRVVRLPHLCPAPAIAGRTAARSTFPSELSSRPALPLRCPSPERI